MVTCRRETEGERIAVEEDRAHGNRSQPPNYTRYPFTAGWTGVQGFQKNHPQIILLHRNGQRCKAAAVCCEQSMPCWPRLTSDHSDVCCLLTISRLWFSWAECELHICDFSFFFSFRIIIVPCCWSAWQCSKRGEASRLNLLGWRLPSSMWTLFLINSRKPMVVLRS